jgi:uncharacterized delta-60 repeat protein
VSTEDWTTVRTAGFILGCGDGHFFSSDRSLSEAEQGDEMRVLRARLRFAHTLMLAAALLVAFAVPSAAAPGQLDLSFGVGGTVVTEFPSSYSGARAVAVQADGRIVAAGFAHTNDSIISDFALTRYDTSGALDPTFGTGGRVRTDFGGRFDEALAVAIQSDGRIVVAGSSSDATGSDMAVARYNDDGTLDISFDGDGLALVDFGSEASARAVALQPDGKVVLAGGVAHPVGAGCCVSDFALARLTSAGAPDTSFDGDGQVVTDFLPGADNGHDAAQAVLVQADGRIVAAGSGVASVVSVDFAVARYLADGSLDPTFSNDGLATTDFVGYFDEIRDLAVDTSGRLVAGGQSCEFPGNSDEVCDFGLVRYSSSGTPDRRFGRQGRIRTDLGGDVGEGIRGVVMQTDGRIVAAGDTSGPGGPDVGLARYRSDGRLDRSFGVNGVVITPVSPSTDEVGGLALQADGRLLVAGTTAVQQSFGFFVSRYLGT